MTDTRIIHVYKNWDTLIPEKVGTLHVEGNRGREIDMRFK